MDIKSLSLLEKLPLKFSEFGLIGPPSVLPRPSLDSALDTRESLRESLEIMGTFLP
jgi:predicted component of type VI protein secretion system